MQYNLVENLQKCNLVQVYNNGDCKTFCKESEVFNKIMQEVSLLTENSREMPAYGVSLHKETINELKKGVWLRLEYHKTQTTNGMMYDALLIQVQPEYMGFNLIRQYKGKYDGRCFYLNLENKNMRTLYDAIANL